jgi:hypothetical protein
MSTPIFSIFCIDYRFNAMVDTYFTQTGNQYNYFASTAPGAGLPLGYEQYCDQVCNSCKNEYKSCKCKCKCTQQYCNPCNPTMKLFKQSLVESLNVALTLKPIKDVYILNHQDCGAIKAFLSCSGYPTKLGENNKKEIEINQTLLTFANNYMLKKFPKIKNTLDLIDINGSVASYNILTKTWAVIFVGEFNDQNGLWYGLKVGDTYKL